jgi:hypothetical protein
VVERTLHIRIALIEPSQDLRNPFRRKRVIAARRMPQSEPFSWRERSASQLARS